jgi:16S rRNA (adenine1518-N6/adenine1519-N6)-dimethyltransferase
MASRSRVHRAASALELAGVRPSKSRGQNFLVQHAIATEIVGAAQIEADDAIIEIGPGLGILTELIVDAAPRNLTLVELDPRLAELLTKRFAAEAGVTIVNRDFLGLAPSELGEGPFKVMGNLPFNSAAAILRRLAIWRDSILRMVLMFQREVAERIRAAPGSREYGALSLYTSLYWWVTGHFGVAAGSFHPRPKVDAEVLIIEPHHERVFDPMMERDISAVVRAAFSAPRKTIRNSLAGGLRLEPKVVETMLEQAGIDPDARPAMLDLPHVAALAASLRRAANPSMHNA